MNFPNARNIHIDSDDDEIIIWIPKQYTRGRQDPFDVYSSV